MSVSNGQLANAATFNGAFVSKSSNSTVSADIQMNGTLTQDKESVLKEIATPSTPASGYGKIYFKNDGKLYQLNDAGIETEVGTGAGGGAGGVNFISNGDAEDNNTTGWATYADAAGTSPVDGTGGTANVTITSTATTPLAGTYSFLMAKDAVNRQGQGWSYDFTVAPAYRAKVLQISFDYLVNSGTFTAGTPSADSDVTVWIYDVTNSQLIQPSSYKLLSNSTGIVDKFNATFQSSATGSSYRLIFHVGSTSASAYTLEVDNVSVSPSVYVYGTPITDWQAYTPTFTNLGTPVTGIDFKWRRVGGVLEIIGYGKSGTVASNQRFTLPSGLNIDTSIAGASGANTLGFFNRLPAAAGSAVTTGGLFYDSALGTQVLRLQTRSDTGLYETTATAAISNNEGFSCRAFVPIQGWSSSVQTSDQTDTRVVAAIYTGNGGQGLTAGTTNITWSTVSQDTHGAWNGTEFTCPVQGFYQINGCVRFTAQVNTDIQAYVDGVVRSQLNGNRDTAEIHSINGLVFCNAGQKISFRSSVGATLSNASVNHCIQINRLSGPSAIAASETVAAKYSGAIAATVSTTAPFQWNTKQFDTHNAVTTGANWRFISPISGTYRVSAVCAITAGSQDIVVYKNGSITPSTLFGANPTYSLSGSISIQLVAGEFIDVRPQTGSHTSVAGTNYSISIERIGN